MEQWSVREVENGFVIIANEDHCRLAAGDMYVAKDVGEVGEVISFLYDTAIQKRCDAEDA